MDKTVAKTITKDEKVIKKTTFSIRYINIMMILSIIKWLFVFGIISLFLFISLNWARDSQLLDLSSFSKMFDEQIRNIDLNEKLAQADTFEETIENIWVLPIALFVFIVLPLLLFYYQYYLRTANYYVVTDKRMIFKRGWLSTEVESIHYERVTDILVKQSFLDKIIFATGNIFISTAGSEGYQAELLHIRNPHKFKKMIYDLKSEFDEDQESDK
ncbi:PH domain-containing protein [Candidatus Falkowbacteria bacterium]|nr:PH domain-containing protein [Candidatus Falkowbacteria bacterium]